MDTTATATQVSDFRVAAAHVTFSAQAPEGLRGQTLPRWSAVDLRTGREVLSGYANEDVLRGRLDAHILEENATPTLAELDRDADGDPYRWDAVLGAFKVTRCCGAASTATGGGVLVCKACGRATTADGPARLA